MCVGWLNVWVVERKAIKMEYGGGILDHSVLHGASWLGGKGNNTLSEAFGPNLSSGALYTNDLYEVC